MYYIYMLRCKDNSIYTGITTNLDRRMEEHFNKDKKAAKYTKRVGALKLEKSFKTDNRKNASKLEWHIKRLNKKQKEEFLLTSDFGVFKGKIQEENYI